MPLKIVTWNISYAFGPGSDGDHRYHQKSESHFKTSLNAIGDVIRGLDADMVLLQEVDFRSKRSHFHDQLDHLSRRSGLLHRNRIITWDRIYVPYPGLNPLSHFGPMVSGGGILSKLPISNVAHDLLAKPRENTRIYNYFYLSRFLQMVETHGIRICNLHLEAFSKDNRELHLIRLKDRLKEYELDLVGGDFNGSIELNEGLKQTWQVFSPTQPTFPSEAPHDTLDQFILRKNRFEKIRISVPDTGTLSDHLPVLIELENS